MKQKDVRLLSSQSHSSSFLLSNKLHRFVIASFVFASLSHELATCDIKLHHFALTVSREASSSLPYRFPVLQVLPILHFCANAHIRKCFVRSVSPKRLLKMAQRIEYSVDCRCRIGVARQWNKFLPKQFQLWHRKRTHNKTKRGNDNRIQLIYVNLFLPSFVV